MKYKLILLLLSFSLGVCSQEKQNPFSEEIIVTKTDHHERVKGTELYAIFPSKYKYSKELGRYQIDDNQFIQFMRMSTSWLNHKKNISKDVFEQGLVIYEEVKVNGFDGMYIEGEDPNSSRNDIILCFGDNDFTVMIFAKTTKENISGKEELINILKSIYIDKDYALNELELATFTFDKSITNYKLAMTGNNIFMYAENGKADAENEFANAMILGNLPVVSDEELLAYMTNMIESHKSKGITIHQPNVINKKIGDYDALVLDTETTYKDKNGILYQVVLKSTDKVLVFVGYGYEDKDVLRDKFIKTAESAKLK